MKNRQGSIGLRNMLQRLSPQYSRANLTMALIVLPLATFAIATVAIAKTQELPAPSVSGPIPLIQEDQLESENQDQQYRIQKALLTQNVFHSSGPSKRGLSGGGHSGRSSPPLGPPRR